MVSPMMGMFTYNLYAAYDVLSIISLGYLHVDFNESDTKISWLNYSHVSPYYYPLIILFCEKKPSRLKLSTVCMHQFF